MVHLCLAVLLLLFCCYPSHSIENFSASIFNFHTEEKYIVVPIYILGLANRLRTMSSVYSIAKVTNRKLIVIWVPNMDCNAGVRKRISCRRIIKLIRTAYFR